MLQKSFISTARLKGLVGLLIGVAIAAGAIFALTHTLRHVNYDEVLAAVQRTDGHVIALALALVAAVISAHAFAGTDASTAVPLWFIAVLCVLAWRYGFVAAAIGSLLCAFVFAHYMFDPTGSWHVEDVAARKNLLWMVVGALAISYLLTPPSSERKGS